MLGWTWPGRYNESVGPCKDPGATKIIIYASPRVSALRCGALEYWQMFEQPTSPKMSSALIQSGNATEWKEILASLGKR